MQDLARLGKMVDYLIAESKRLRTENASLTQDACFKRQGESEPATFRLALAIIKDGSVPGGSVMVEQGNWKAFARALQEIAAEALEKQP